MISTPSRVFVIISKDAVASGARECDIGSSPLNRISADPHRYFGNNHKVDRYRGVTLMHHPQLQRNT